MSFIEVIDMREKLSKNSFENIKTGSIFIYEDTLYKKISAVMTSFADMHYMNLETKTYKEVVVNCISVEDGIPYYLPQESLIQPVKCKLIIEKND